MRELGNGLFSLLRRAECWSIPYSVSHYQRGGGGGFGNHIAAARGSQPAVSQLWLSVHKHLASDLQSSKPLILSSDSVTPLVHHSFSFGLLILQLQ